jgi:hypothetical protein
MLMNTINPGSSGPGDVFFTDETWLMEGSNDIVSWVEAGQFDERFKGLIYFWAEMFLPQSRDFHGLVFTEHDLAPISSADATAGTTVQIRRTAPDLFTVRVLTSEHTYTAQAENFMWTRAKDFGDIEMGLELAGTTGAFAPPVSMQPRWWDATGALHEWSLPSSPSPAIGTPSPEPPVQAGWLTPPGPNGAVWLTSCCTPPAHAMAMASAMPALRMAARMFDAPLPTTPPAPNTPIDHPPIAPIGVPAANQDLVAHPGSLPQAVENGLLGKIGGTSVAVTGSACGTASTVGQQLPGPSTAGLDDSRQLCWFKFSGNFGVAAPKTPERASTTIRFDSAYAVFDAQSHNLLSAGAFQPHQST